MSLVLNVEILGEFKKLTTATQGAQGQLQSMNKKAQSVSRSINRAFAAVGLGLSFAVLKRELEEASKAAVADIKSQGLLALAMKNTGKATDASVASAEEAIRQMQLQSSVADDDIRPAYQKLFLATGDVTKANGLMQVALDTAAFSGKDLGSVAQAMSKSLAGSDTALLKLIPSLKNSKDPMKDLAEMTAGAAEAAANLDPYARMQVIFGEIQEQIGTALLPILNEFSTWLATPEGQEKLQEIVDFIVTIITTFTTLVGYIVENKDWLVPVIVALGGLVLAWKGVQTAIAVADAAQALFGANAIAKAGIAMAAWAPLAALLGIAAVSNWAGQTLQTSSGTTKQTLGSAFSLNSTASASAGGSNMSFNGKTGQGTNTVVQNITIQGSQSAQQIKNVLQRSSRANGTAVLSLGGL